VGALGCLREQSQDSWEGEGPTRPPPALRFLSLRLPLSVARTGALPVYPRLRHCRPEGPCGYQAGGPCVLPHAVPRQGARARAPWREGESEGRGEGQPHLLPASLARHSHSLPASLARCPACLARSLTALPALHTHCLSRSRS